MTKQSSAEVIEVRASDTASEVLCVHCDEPESSHGSGKKCLFAATSFRGGSRIAVTVRVDPRGTYRQVFGL